MNNKFMLACAAMLVVSLTGCSKVDQTHFDQIKTGMQRDEVEAVLGSGKCDAMIAGMNCTWEGMSDAKIEISFIADRVVMVSAENLK